MALSQSSPYPEPSSIQLDRDSEFLIQSFLPPSPPPEYAPPGLPLPFCTPQITPSFDAPFARGYNRALQDSVGISQDELLAFLDGLNIAMTASPPLRVVNLAGMVIGFIPYHWAMIAGAVMQTAAQTGMHILSKTVTDRYLRAANRRIFRPRGLVVRLCTTAAMQHLVMHAADAAGPSTMTKIGRGVGTVLLHAPLPFSSRIVRAIADKPPVIPPSISAVGDGRHLTVATQRRLAALAGHALPLDLAVPPAKAQGVIDTMSQWGVNLDMWRTGRQQDKVERRRRELGRIESQLGRLGIDPHGGGRTPPSGPPIGDAELYVMGRRERKDLRRAARRAHKREVRGPGLIGSLIGPKEGRLERRVANADLLEHWATDKVIWVVIMNADKDKEIEGIERADDLKNEEQVDNQTWKAQIMKERDALEEEEDDEEELAEEAHGRFSDSKR
ncbi:hypothetical protein GGX14DRAFT_501037 [Mycena pura]|uniref:Uncharacterized protein n=1 Tax=Mycena pura TaxID=153505 RepID=A0AAD6V9Q4_9AGAR|nr:hypothetical protein GGX14DRAFT_501037 [Mycena pura]